MLKILQARLQQYMNCELPDVQAGFGKGRGTRHQISNIRWIIEKAREFQKNIYFCFIDNAKECSNYRIIALISHASKVMLKILQARLQQYVNLELLVFQLVLEKAEEPEIKLPVSAGSWKKQESSRKTSISALLTMPKPLTVWITINCGKF